MPARKRNIAAEYGTEGTEHLTKMQPTFSLWRERGDNAPLTAAAQALPAMIVGLAAGVRAYAQAPRSSPRPPPGSTPRPGPPLTLSRPPLPPLLFVSPERHLGLGPATG
jgi:hypothetical protein